MFLLIAILTTAACTTSTPSTPDVEAEGDARSGGTALPNLLVEVQGEVWLRRAGWKDFLPAGFGVAVFPGDLLRVDAGSVASVFCGDEASWEGGPESLSDDGMEHGVPCQAGRPPRPWTDIAALRSEDDVSRSYILQPRTTALLSDRPQVRWHEMVAGVPHVITVIADDGKDRAEVEAIGGVMEWPASWSPLEVDATYLLRVCLEGETQEMESTRAGQGFWLLGTGEVEQIQVREERLRIQPLSSTAIDLLVAELYLNHGMRAEAITLLQGLADRDGKPAVWLSLGRVYLEIGVALEARGSFDQALMAAQASGELEAEAEAHVGLGLSIRILGEDSLARDHFKTALELYEKIGDRETVEEVNQLLADN